MRTAAWKLRLGPTLHIRPTAALQVPLEDLLRTLRTLQRLVKAGAGATLEPGDAVGAAWSGWGWWVLVSICGINSSQAVESDGCACLPFPCPHRSRTRGRRRCWWPLRQPLRRCTS